MRARVAAGCAALWLALACASPPLAPSLAPLPADDPRPAADLAGLRALAEARHALRASARLHLRSRGGESSARYLLLAERPGRLRVEVLGLVGQRVALLASDGSEYALWRSDAPAIERGAVHPGVLQQVAGVPLSPRAAVALLLAAPRVPADDGPLRGFALPEGGVRVELADAALEFDAQGRLRAYETRADDGAPALVARFDDYPESLAGVGFPRRVVFDFPELGIGADVEYRTVELDPVLAPELFRLAPVGSVSSAAGGEGS